MTDILYSRSRSYGRVFLGVSKLEQWPLTLDPQLSWTAHTHGAPGRSLLPQETVLAHYQYIAALSNTHPEDGRSVDDWAQLYVYALGVLPLFDPSSIPAHLIVDKQGKCFLVKALAHPDDRISRAAAHALQRIMRAHMALRVPVFRALLNLMGRVPETDVAVRTTTLSHFAHLIGIWIRELDTMDPFKLTTAAMLEPLEPYLAKLEAEALIAMCHAHACVRLAAVELLHCARALGEALQSGYERMISLITGETQAAERAEQQDAEISELLDAEADIRDARRRAKREKALAASLASHGCGAVPEAIQKAMDNRQKRRASLEGGRRGSACRGSFQEGSFGSSKGSARGRSPSARGRSPSPGFDSRRGSLRRGSMSMDSSRRRDSARGKSLESVRKARSASPNSARRGGARQSARRGSSFRGGTSTRRSSMMPSERSFQASSRGSFRSVSDMSEGEVRTLHTLCV